MFDADKGSVFMENENFMIYYAKNLKTALEALCQRMDEMVYFRSFQELHEIVLEQLNRTNESPLTYLLGIMEIFWFIQKDMMLA